MAKKYTKVAIAYDFDGTLAPGNMQEHNFIPAIGMNGNDFWNNVKKDAKEHDMDEVLSYMYLMLHKAGKADLPIKKSSFIEYGGGINFFDGVVDGYFDRINNYASSKNIELEHYIISSGLREMIEGTAIKKHFKAIFASGFRYDVNGVAVWPALAVNYTNKTQFLFRISKGIINSWDNTTINQFMLDSERLFPFSNIVYIGDGETDVPAMKMVKHNGGTSIAVYNSKIKKTVNVTESPKDICKKLIDDSRADYIAPADYTKDSELDKIIKRIIDKISINIELESMKNNLLK